MWATRAAAVMALVAVCAPSTLAAETLARRCRACPLIVPECHACPDGQTCRLTTPSCTECARAECVDVADTVPPTGSVPPLVTSGITPFPTMALPPGVTPTTVSPDQQSAGQSGAPSDTGTSEITTHAPVPVTPSGSRSTDAAESSDESSSDASAASQTSSSSTSAGAAAAHGPVPWAVEAVLAAVGVLAL